MTATARPAGDRTVVADGTGPADPFRRPGPPEQVTRLLSAVRQVKLLWADVTRSAFPAGASGLGVLYLLDAQGPQRVSDLATCGHVGVSTMSRHVADLTAAGLLDRELAPDDGRTHLVRLTAAGAAALERARAAVADRLDPALAGWTDDETDTLCHLLQRLAADVAAATGRTPGRT